MGDWEHIDIILYTSYQETLDTGLLLRPVFNRLSHRRTLTLAPVLPSTSQDPSVYLSDINMWAAGRNRKKTLFDKYVSTLPIKYYSNCFPICLWSQGVAALATGPVLMSPVFGVSTVSSAWPGHCPATTGLVSWYQHHNHRIT